MAFTGEKMLFEAKSSYLLSWKRCVGFVHAIEDE